MQYFASTIPVMKEASLLQRNDRRKPKMVKIEAPAFVGSLEPGDELWLSMGSTNAAVTLGAHRRGATVHQVSYARALPHVQELRNGSAPGNGRIKISPDDIWHLAESHPEIFYDVLAQQTEILDIMSAWQQVEDCMEERKRYANLVRSRLQQDAVVSGNVASIKELEDLIKERVGKKDPQDPGMQIFLRQEKRAEARLAKLIGGSGLYLHVFGPIEGVGPKLTARFISAIERIERFPGAEDLMRYAGMLPTRDGRLPSRKHGGLVSRSPELNTACFNLQNWMFKYGANSEFGSIIHDQINKVCPCKQEERDADKDLKAKHGVAIRQARIAMTRVFLDRIWHGWREYMGN